jgi:hypothetical protein
MALGDEAKGTWRPTEASFVANSMLEPAQLLVMYGFVNKKGKQFYDEHIKGKDELRARTAVLNLGAKKAAEYAAQERSEVVDGSWAPTNYPDGSVRYHIVLESATEGIEDSYYDILERCRTYFGFSEVYKVTDYFAASENSAFFGNSQQRLGLQQDRVQQFLANIGKFVKDLFQMVRELRIIDERLAAYDAAGGVGSKNHKFPDPKFKHSASADVSLKSIFTDLVEGGTKNPQSVFGLAQQVGFTLLPDLFFNEYVAKPSEIDARVDAMPYNKSVKAVLKRKLYQYLTWKEQTYAELMARRTFNVKYLRQHWTIIRMYMAWVKPYLKNIQRLTMNAKYQDSPDLIAAFEGSYIEVEFVAAKPLSKGYHGVILASFAFRTRPEMSARKEYQTGPVHLGRMDLNLRAYGWTPEELKAFRDMKRREDIELLGLLDTQLVDVMNSLGADFEKYLEEAGEPLLKAEPPKDEKKKLSLDDTALGPFVSIFQGFAELTQALVPVHLFSGGGKQKSSSGPSASGAAKARDKTVGSLFLVYNTYKKSRRMTTW